MGKSELTEYLLKFVFASTPFPRIDDSVNGSIIVTIDQPPEYDRNTPEFMRPVCNLHRGWRITRDRVEYKLKCGRLPMRKHITSDTKPSRQPLAKAHELLLFVRISCVWERR